MLIVLGAVESKLKREDKVHHNKRKTALRAVFYNQKAVILIKIRLNSKGLTLLELVATVAILSIVSVMTFSMVQETRRKKLRTEAKVGLASFHKAQMRFHFEHGAFTKDIDEILFPNGILRYNIGFNDSLTDRNNTGTPPTSGVNNLWEMCGKTFDIGSSVSTTSTPNTSDPLSQSACAFQKPDGTEFEPPDIVNATFNATTKKYKAFAAGNLMSDDNSDTASKNIDRWSIDEKGNVDNCQSPWDTSLSC